MHKAEIKVGGVYFAKVNGSVTTVRVEYILDKPGHSDRYFSRRASTSYRVTNLRTGRETYFRSASKFRGPATEVTKEVSL